MIVMKKNTPIAMGVIDGRSLSSRPMTHETKALDIIIDTHTNRVAFIVISSSINPIVLGLSWSFCTTFEWIGIQKVFILMCLKK
jgi:hypothetical protein